MGGGSLPSGSASRVRRQLVGGEWATCVSYREEQAGLEPFWGPAGPGRAEGGCLWRRGEGRLFLEGRFHSLRGKPPAFGEEAARWVLGNGGGRNGAVLALETSVVGVRGVALLVWFGDLGDIFFRRAKDDSEELETSADPRT